MEVIGLLGGPVGTVLGSEIEVMGAKVFRRESMAEVARELADNE